MPLIYLVCPYSHPDAAVRAERYQAAVRAVDTLLARGVMVLSGRVYVEQLETRDPAALWPLFRTLIERADEVWVLAVKDWERSIGVRLEIEHARACGKPVTQYLHPLCTEMVNAS